MAITQGVLGGLAAGARFAEGGRAAQAQQFQQTRQQADDISSNVDDLATQAAELNKQFSIQKAAARTPEEAEQINQNFGRLFTTLQGEVSRVTQVAAEAGLPIDPQVELAKLLPQQQLADLRAEAVVAAQAAGQKAGAEKGAELQAQTTQQPLQGAEPFINEAGETVFVTPAGQIVSGGKLSRLPTTQIQIEEQLPETQPIQPVRVGMGAQIMEDIKQSAGIIGGISKGLSRTGGQFVPGVNPRLDAETRVKNFNQEFKFGLSRNPKYPVAEINALSENLPDPTGIFTDPEAEANKLPIIREMLLDFNEADRSAFEGLSKKGKQAALDRMGTRQALLNMIGDLPPSGVGADEADQRIDALDQKGFDNLTPAEKDELRELLRAQGLL